jgi:uridine kinase
MVHRSFLVGIAGLSASGKTSLLRDLAAQLPSGACAVISQDNYYRPLDEQERDAAGQTNFDLPTAFHHADFVRDLRTLLAGGTIARTEYSFNCKDRPALTVSVGPAEVILAEGLFVFHCEEVRALLDLKVFIDAGEEICLSRRLERDVRERNYSRAAILYQWHHHVLPAYRQYVLPYRDEAHLVVDNSQHYAAGLDAVCQRVLAGLAR